MDANRTLAFWAMLKEPPPPWLCPIHFKIGVGKARRSRVLLPKASSFPTKRLAQVTTLGRTGARCDKPRGCCCRSIARFAAKEFQRLERSGGARATDYYTRNVGEGLEPETTIAAVHDLLLQASQQLAVTGLAK